MLTCCRWDFNFLTSLCSWGDWFENRFVGNPEDRFSHDEAHLSRNIRFPTMWYVRLAKAQTSLCIRAVWSEPLLVAWIFYDYQATDQTTFGVYKLKRRLHRLVWVYTCQNATLLEITCRGSNMNVFALTLCIPEPPKRVFRQTVKTQNQGLRCVLW